VDEELCIFQRTRTCAFQRRDSPKPVPPVLDENRNKRHQLMTSIWFRTCPTTTARIIKLFLGGDRRQQRQALPAIQQIHGDLTLRNMATDIGVPFTRRERVLNRRAWRLVDVIYTPDEKRVGQGSSHLARPNPILPPPRALSAAVLPATFPL